MDRTNHELVTVGLSILTGGIVVPVAAAIADPAVLDYAVLTVSIGASLGSLLVPAALFARWDMECRASFAWVVVPTAVLTWLASDMRDAGVGFLVSVATYITTCVLVGLVALPRRRRLNWYYSGCCSNCGYDVRGLEGPKCPECGKDTTIKPRWRVPPEVMRP